MSRDKDFKMDWEKMINMERGWPCKEQLELSMPMLDLIKSDSALEWEVDYRGYAGDGGIIPLKKIFCEVFDCDESQMYVGGTMSTSLMFDIVMKGMFFGFEGHRPWKDFENVKFICPSPGYEKHFKICEYFGIEMIPVDILEDGPDMDTVEELVSNDESIKGIWCVPLYSNPTGTVYSDEVITRIAKMKTKAPEFRVFWDNAYFAHHLTNNHYTIKNIITECEKYGEPNRVFEFFSTSKITFPGGGVAGFVSSKENISWYRKKTLLQLKSGDKINQLRHALFLKDKAGIISHMEKHKKIIAPKFKLVDDILTNNFAKNEDVIWDNPKGGYFFCIKLKEGKAKLAYEKCKEKGVSITPAGSIFPYGNDPKMQYLRLAPTYPSMDELEVAINIFCEAIKEV